MAITEKELQISNKSYTHKDFEAIYTELITFAENLSKRYSPTTSNESDPFIVLLKLAAFVADKVNYNLDKNILERFILSCTQRTSMQDITSRLGYNMHYYIASATDVTFSYDFSELTTDTESEDYIDNILVPRFSIVSNDDSIQFITTADAYIERASNASSPVKALQGKIKTLAILGSDTVELENLNSANMIYFPERMVAENGVFINVDSLQEWKRSYNLNTELYGSYVYKFGFDSIKNLPYLEFPSWISSIIGDGLKIQYVVTDGAAGNIAAQELKNVTRSNNDAADDTQIGVYNASAADTGKDPETIDESYQGFKKIIGTFDTLVTCRDYANKIYQLISDLTEDPLVSNVQVGDRRTDINYACDVITLNNLEQQVESVPFEIDGNQAISPFDICLYAFNPIYDTTENAVNNVNGYNNSYTLNLDTTTIENKIEEYKTISHDYHSHGTLFSIDSPKEITIGEIGGIIIEYSLNAVITTTKKVNYLEQQDIITNVKNALLKNYNPRNLEFGNEISFDSIVETIQNSDERIKLVSLGDPTQTPKILQITDDGQKLIDLYLDNDNSSNEYQFIVAKNLLAGKVPLYKYNIDFNYNYNQKDVGILRNIDHVSSKANIAKLLTKTSSAATYVTDSYTLSQNEVIQFIAPKLISKLTYAYGNNYCFFSSNNDTIIRKNTEYKLKSGEHLLTEYIDTNGNDIMNIYNEGTIIYSTFDIPTSESMISSRTPTLIYNIVFQDTSQTVIQSYTRTTSSSELTPKFYFYTVDTKDQIEYKTTAVEKLTTVAKLYWITKNKKIDETQKPISSYIDWRDCTPAGENEYKEYEYILDDDEYFFYADSQMTSLFAFGAGTRLAMSLPETGAITNLEPDSEHINWSCESIDVDLITTRGLKQISPYFVPKSFQPIDAQHTQENNLNRLRIYENDVITLTENDQINITHNNQLDNIYFKPSNNIYKDYMKSFYNNSNQEQSVEVLKTTYTINNESFDIPNRGNLDDDMVWRVEGLLDIYAGPSSAQKLINNQEVTFYSSSYSEDDPQPQTYKEISASDSANSFMLSILTQKPGSDNIPLRYINLNGEYDYPDLLCYEENDSSNDCVKLDSNFYKCNLNAEKECTLWLPVIEDADNPGNNLTRYIAFYITSTDIDTEISDVLCVENLQESSLVRIIPSSTELAADKFAEGFNLFKCSTDDPDKSKLIIEGCSSSPSYDYSKITIIAANLKEGSIAVNPNLGLKPNDDILTFIQTVFPAQFEKWYITNDMENTRRIELFDEETLASPRAFYDYNNIANKWVLPKIVFNPKKTDIIIAHSSKL